MKALLKHLPVILIIVIELVFGIMLFVNPELFTTVVISVIGGLLIIIGGINLFRYVKAKQNGESSALTLTVSVILVLLGIFALFFPKTIIEMIASLVLVYGIVLAISGIYKIGLFIDFRKALIPVNFMHLISGLLAIVLGVVIMFQPFKALNVMWIFTGILLIVMAAVDIASLIMNVVLAKKNKGEKQVETAAESASE